MKTLKPAVIAVIPFSIKILVGQSLINDGGLETNSRII